MAASNNNEDLIQIVEPRVINLDVEQSSLKEYEARYIKNLRWQVAKNSSGLGNSTTEGENKQKLVPLNSTLAVCSPNLPAGLNVCVLTYESKATNEIYWGVWNFNPGNNTYTHGLYVLNQNGICTTVYQGANLNFQLQPRYQIAPHKCWLEVLNSQDANGNSIQQKNFIYVDGFNRQRFIDVNTSIATGSFNVTNFPYYQPFYPFCDVNEYIELPTRPHYNAPLVTVNTSLVQVLTLAAGQSSNNFNVGDGVEGSSSNAAGIVANINANANTISVLILSGLTIFTTYDTVTDTTTDATLTLNSVTLNNQNLGLPNLIADQTFQFRTGKYFRDGRQTTWSPISTLSFTSLSPCESNSENLPRSFNLLIDAGSALVEKILIAYRICNGDADGTLNANADGTPGIPSDWNLCATVNKYKPAAPGQPFYTRQIGLPNYNAPLAPCSPDSVTAGDGLANTFIFYFDNSFKSVPISVTDTNRLYDDIPFTNYGLTSAGDNIILANGLFGWDNLSVTETNKFNISVGDQATVCSTEMVTIIVDAVIHNNFWQQNEYISSPESAPPQEPQYFGGWGGGSNFPDNMAGYNQTLATGLGGFIGYLAGTNYYAISQQYQNRVGYVGVQGQGSPDLNFEAISQGQYYYQRFIFNVPAGNYVFRIASHLSLLSANYQKTSTYVSGLVTKAAYNYGGDAGNPGAIYDAGVGTAKELVINACGGDYISPYFVIIQDLTQNDEGDPLFIQPQAVCGYLQEDEISQVPIELALLQITTSGINPIAVQYGSKQTDHNGFFFAAGNNSGSIRVEYQYEAGVPIGEDCSAPLNNTYISNSSANLATLPQYITDLGTTIYDYYVANSHFLITGKATDCNNKPIQGLVVVLTRSQFAITDGNGIFTIEAHNNVYNLPGQMGNSQGRTEDGDLLVVSQNGVCIIINCTGEPCDPCITPIDVNFNGLVCWNAGNEGEHSQTINFQVSLVGDNLKGLKNGGTYGIGAIVGDECGRESDINFIDYLNIPVSMSNCVFAPYEINLKLTSKLAFTDPNIKTVRLARTKNLNYSSNPAVTGSYLQWVIGGTGNCATGCDPAYQFIDAQGNPTSANTATYIKIFIDGLNNYNQINNFATNDAFTWADGARIRFLVNGDGTCFNVNSNSLVFTLTDGVGVIDLPLRGTLPFISGAVNPNATGYFVIDYDTRLQNLIGGAMVELYYPKQSEETETYYEISTITFPNGNNFPLTFIYLADDDPTHSGLWVNGNPILINTDYTLNTFDTYWLRRGIPQNSAITSSNPVAQPIIFTPAYMFEHYAPNDFCCSYCEDIGREGVINIYAVRQWRPLEAEASNVVVNNGVINGISTFYTANQTIFSVSNHFGDITAIQSDGKILFVICEHACFKSRINDNYLRITLEGGVYGSASYLSLPPEIVGNYGLQYNYPRAAIFHKGIIWWADVSEGTIVECDYNKVESISDQKVKSYFNEKLKTIDTINQAGNSYVTLLLGLDPKNKEILVTSYYNNQKFANTDRQIVIANNDTIVYDYISKEWVRFSTGTPEGYCQFTSSLDNIELITFVLGASYQNNNDTVSTWNNFYGTQGERIVDVIFNVNPPVQKKWLTIAEYCLQCAWFVDRIITQAGQQSQIVLLSFTTNGQRESIWYSEIFRDQNSPNFITTPSSSPLYDGDPLFGTWIRMRFVGDNSFDSSYSELEKFIIKAIISQRTIK